jgi:RNA-binding protein YhbY
LKPSWRNTLSQTYNVLIATELKGISEDAEKEIDMRLEEHGLEKIPTLNSTWEMKCTAEDESEAKDQAIQIFVNVCRTYPFELRMVVHAGISQIIRRKKTFEP